MNDVGPFCLSGRRRREKRTLLRVRNVVHIDEGQEKGIMVLIVLVGVGLHRVFN